MKLFSSPRYVVDIGSHVFPTRKFGLVADALKSALELVEPALPSREELLLAHDEAWVDKVIHCRMTLADETLMELPFSPALSEAHRLQVSGTILACRQALGGGVGLHAGGGSHHAFADHGEGFCVLNDLASGILAMRRERRISRASVIDLDVHHGNGTAAMFADDPDVFTFSMHQEDLYPAKKPASSLDIALPAKTADQAYLKLLEKHLDAVFAHEPELVVYQAGVDVSQSDLLGGLKLTAVGIKKRDELVRDACRRRGVPVAVTRGGGYASDLRHTVALHVQTLRAFC